MNKDLGATLSRCDESEAAIIVPLCESAFCAHTKGLTLGLTGSQKWSGLERSGKPRSFWMSGVAHC